MLEKGPQAKQKEQAFMMALHPRLGKESSVGKLHPESLDKIGSFSSNGLFRGLSTTHLKECISRKPGLQSPKPSPKQSPKQKAQRKKPKAKSPKQKDKAKSPKLFCFSLLMKKDHHESCLAAF